MDRSIGDGLIGEEVTIVDCGISNTKSVANMIRKVGGIARIASDPRHVESAKKLILPGIGAFDKGIANLKGGGFLEVLNERVVRDRVPVLGICLGMQMFARCSEEGKESGLGWIDGTVRRFDFSRSDEGLKIPHMGWNFVRPTREHPMFRDAQEPMRFYFVHSYHFDCACGHDELAVAEYGYEFACAVGRDNIVGVQFHPEKSHKYGMQIVSNFVRGSWCS